MCVRMGLGGGDVCMNGEQIVHVHLTELGEIQLMRTTDLDQLNNYVNIYGQLSLRYLSNSCSKKAVNSRLFAT